MPDSPTVPATEPAVAAPIPQPVLMRRFAAVLGAWTVVSSAATLLAPGDARDAWYVLMVVAPVVVLPALCAVAYARMPRFRATLLALDLSAVVAAQGMRMGGLTMVMLWLVGAMTPVFGAWAGGIDVIVGITALPMAYLVAFRRPLPRRLLRAWSGLGLLDFVVATPLGLLSTPSALGLLHAEPTTALMVTFPLSFIPAVGVPLMIVLHGVVLVQTRAGRTPRTHSIVHMSDITVRR